MIAGDPVSHPATRPTSVFKHAQLEAPPWTKPSKQSQATLLLASVVELEVRVPRRQGNIRLDL